MWFYHLRDVRDGKTYYGGGAPDALCGAKLGWDTKIPLDAYGQKSHIPTKWCEDCFERSGLDKKSKSELRRLAVQMKVKE